MITRFRSTFIALVLATLMVAVMGALMGPPIGPWMEQSHAAVAVFQNSGSFEPSNSELVPESPALGVISRFSNPGEIASGSESGYLPGQRVVLNIRPCRGADGEFVSFRWPFKRNVVGSVNCGGSQVSIVQIQQQ